MFSSEADAEGIISFCLSSFSFTTIVAPESSFVTTVTSVVSLVFPALSVVLVFILYSLFGFNPVNSF